MGTRIRTLKTIQVRKTVMLFYYLAWKRNNPNAPFSSIPDWVINEPTKVLQYSRHDLEDFKVHGATTKAWRNLGLKEFKFRHWYFGFVIRVDKNGVYFAEVRKVQHESEHYDNPSESTKKIDTIITEVINRYLGRELLRA